MKYNILLEGPIGTGKTHSLRTLVEDCDKKLFVVSTEPGIHNILGDLPEDKCHWAYISPAGRSWEIILDQSEKINRMTMEAITKQPKTHWEDYQQFLHVVERMANFVCDRTGEEFGPVDEFDESCALAVDGLTGLSQMASDLVVGPRLIKSQPEWGAAMAVIEEFVRKCVSDTKCTFVLVSHVDKEPDHVLGGHNITVSTLGQKLAPKIPKMFDEVVFTKRSEDNFVWSTIEPGVDLKTRVLGWQDDLKPTFAQFPWGDGKLAD